jgi:chitodextrinase
VSVSAPASAATIAAGSTVTVTAAATDAISTVASVEILIDGVSRIIRNAAPYTYSWNTAGLALNTAHNIQARATDSFGNTSASPVTTVTIADKAAPTASVTSPAAGAILRGPITLNATAADDAAGSGLAKVEFYIDGQLVGTDTTSPYTAAWDSRSAADVSLSLTVKAYDLASVPNVGTSTAVAIKTDNTAPSTPPSLRAGANTSASIVIEWGASTDANTVQGYQVQIANQAVVRLPGTARSHTFSGLTPSTAYAVTVTAIDTAGNVSAAAGLTSSTAAGKQGDLNGDNVIGIADLSILMSKWNTTDAVSDMNDDTKVNIIDLSILLSNWGK